MCLGSFLFIIWIGIDGHIVDSDGGVYFDDGWVCDRCLADC